MKDLAPLVAKANRGGPGESLKTNKINLVISVQEKKKQKQGKRITYKTKENYVRERH